MNDAYAIWAQNQSIFKYDFSSNINTTVTGNVVGAQHIACDATNVYLVNWSSNNVDGNATVLQVAQDRTYRTPLADAQSSPAGIAADADYVYWANGTSTDGRIMRVPIGGGTTTTLTVGKTPQGLALHGSMLYWTNGGDGTVMAMNITTGEIVTVTSGQSNPGPMVVYGNSLYWLNAGTGTDGSIMSLGLQ